MKTTARQLGRHPARLARRRLAVPGLIAVLVAAIVIAWSAATTSAATAAEDDVVTWGVRPVKSNDPDQADRANFSFELKPGESLDDGLVVTNHDERPIRLDLYAADAFLGDSGQLDVLPAGEESTTLGAWITMDRARVTIAPEKSKRIGFDLAIPDSVEPGDYSAAVITSLRTRDPDEGITVDRRLGIRMHVRVGGPITPSVSVTDIDVDYDDQVNPVGRGAASVTYTVSNTGNVRVTTAHDVEISGPFGILTAKAKPFDGVELLPGSSIDYEVSVPAVTPLVRPTAKVTVDPTVVPAPGRSPQAAPATVEEQSFWAVPWALLTVIAVIGLTVVAARHAREQRKSAEEERISTAVAEALSRRD